MGALHARRAITGEWLHHDVPMDLKYTHGRNGGNHAEGTIPYALDRATASDGLPMWLERGTVVILDDDDGGVEWAGLCTYSDLSSEGRRVEFGGMLSLYDFILFDGLWAQWHPFVQDAMQALLNNAHAQPGGNLGIQLSYDPELFTFIGDSAPAPYPTTSPRYIGETDAQYAGRLAALNGQIELWEALYSGREPVRFAWWDLAYIGDLLRAMPGGQAQEDAEVFPFQFYERSSWIGPLNPKHELVVEALTPSGGGSGEARTDIAIVQGVNLVTEPVPATNADLYSNDLVTVGHGEGAARQLGRASAPDYRVRTTRLVDTPYVWGLTTLGALAAELLPAAAAVSQSIETVTVTRGSMPGLHVGDLVPLVTDRLEATVRVVEMTQSSRGGDLELRFDTGANQGLTL